MLVIFTMELMYFLTLKALIVSTKVCENKFFCIDIGSLPVQIIMGKPSVVF